MPKLLKIVGLLILISFGCIILAIIATQVSAGSRLRKEYHVDVELIPIPTDEVSIERGSLLVRAGRCTECHGLNLAGQVTADDAAVGQIYASNLTAGQGGVGQTYQDVDWIRSIRHGIGPDGRSLVITPAQYYYYLSDEDLGAIIAYIKSIKPIDKELPSPSVGLLGRFFLSVFSPRDWLPAEKIDHTATRPVAPDPSVTAEYGRYLVQTRTCLVCHNQKEISAAPKGDLAGLSFSEFQSTMRFSDDSAMRRSVDVMTPEDFEAMWLYLQTLPAGG